MQRIEISTGTVTYPVLIGQGLLGSLGPRLGRICGRGSRATFVLTSPAIWSLWGGRFLQSFAQPPVCLFLPPGERHKTLRQVERLAREMALAGADRSSLLIAFGGGIVGDVGGFLAASFMRGIDCVQVPTTLLAQVDSSIGGKTGVNLPEGKNLFGAFHHPRAVLADTDVLQTLPARELRSGLFEVIKAGIIRDRALLRYLETHAGAILSARPAALERILAAAVRVKAGVVEADERESGPRMLLNFGHTVGHAIETVTGYRQMLHGEAVAWGMLAALYLGRERGTLPSREAERLERLIFAYGPLPPLRSRADRLARATARDKKNTGAVRRFILPHGAGRAEICEQVTAEEIEAACRLLLVRSREVYGG